MALETATFIDGLVPANPSGTDDTSQGDDHIRLLKSTIRNTLPNITGPVTATQDDLNSIPTLTAELPTFFRLDGSRPMTGDVDMDGNKVTDLAPGTDPTDAVTKAQLDAVDAAGLTLSAIREAVFPVGFRIMLGVTTDPAVLLGVGTWTQVSRGRYVAGSGTGPVGSLGLKSTGGDTDFTLEFGNLPAHTHKMFKGGGKVTSGTRLGSSNAPADYALPSFDGADFRYGIVGVDGPPNVGETSSTGSAAPVTHNPPYEAVAIWERVS